jgi:hypothetical protein
MIINQANHEKGGALQLSKLPACLNVSPIGPSHELPNRHLQ